MVYLILFFFIFQNSAFADTKSPIHIVKKGETLFSIAKNYNLKISDLFKYNPSLKQNSSLLKYGQKILIKNENKEIRSIPQTYKVKKKDTLFSIGKRFKMDHKLLMLWNKIKDPSDLQEGQTLFLDKPGFEKSIPVFLNEKTPSKKKPSVKLFSQVFSSKSDKNAPGHSLKDRVSLEDLFSSSNFRNQIDSKKFGIHFTVNKNYDVLAFKKGLIVFNSIIQGYGQTLILKHTHEDNLYSIYSSPGLKVFKKKGEFVLKSEKLGTLISSKFKLFFQIWKENTFKNPLSFIKN